MSEIENELSKAMKKIYDSKNETIDKLKKDKEESMKKKWLPMPEYKVVRRTFEAFKFPKGSPERNRLNRNSLTSEHARNCPYLVMKDGKPAKSVPDLETANDLIKNPQKYMQHVTPYTPEKFNEGSYWSAKRKGYFTRLK